MKTAQHILDGKGHNVWSVHPDVSVYDAIQEMTDKDVGALTVIEDGKLVGILSERDYARPEQTVEQCMAVMTEKRVRHLPVLHKKKNSWLNLDWRCGQKHNRRPEIHHRRA